MDLKNITKLTIVICVPNPDDLGGADLNMEERLKSIGADKIKEEYAGKDIKPDQNIKSKLKQII